MKNSVKKCKGIGKAIDFEGCRTESMWRKYGLCRNCYPIWLLNTPEGAEVVAKSTISAVKRVERDTLKHERKKKREFKEINKSIQKLIQEARVPFQVWIKFRDANKGCVSCNTTESDIYDAGHFKKAEVFTGLIFDERNVHKQCRKCNRYLNGNEGEYRKRLVSRFGQEWIDKLDEDADKSRKFSWSREALSELKERYKKLIKEQKK